MRKKKTPIKPAGPPPPRVYYCAVCTRVVRTKEAVRAYVRVGERVSPMEFHTECYNMARAAARSRGK